MVHKVSECAERGHRRDVPSRVYTGDRQRSIYPIAFSLPSRTGEEVFVQYAKLPEAHSEVKCREARDVAGDGHRAAGE